MNTKHKIIFLVITSILVISVVFLPCFAFADTLDDYGSSYHVYTDTTMYYQMEVYPFEMDNPISSIETKLPYSDNDPGFSFLYVEVIIESYYGYYREVVASNSPNVLVKMFDTANDPDHQDAIAYFDINFYSYYNGDIYVYAYDIDFSNEAGYEEIDTDTIMYVTASFVNLIDPPKNFDDYYQGLNEGYEAGFKDGTDYGKAIAEGDGLGGAMDTFKGIFNWLGTVFMIELIPGISIGMLILIPAFFAIVLFIIHFVRG